MALAAAAFEAATTASVRRRLREREQTLAVVVRVATPFPEAGAVPTVVHLKLNGLCRHAGPHPGHVGIETCSISPEVTNTTSPR